MAFKLLFQSLLFFVLPREPRNPIKSKKSMISRFRFLGLLLLLLLLLIPIFLLLPFFPVEFSILPRHSHNEIHVEVDKICKALWDSDFKVMSLLLEMHLPKLLQTCHNIKHSEGITIFAPSDKNIYDFYMKYCREEIKLEYQIMTSKLDEEAFELMTSKLDDKDFGVGINKVIFQSPTCNPSLNLSVNSHGSVQRFHSSITHWDIYNDGFVAVHGVDSFFRNFSGFLSSEAFELKSWLSFYEQIYPC